ncbi:Metallothionein expression activator [Schizosaccharomyces pombe]
MSLSYLSSSSQKSFESFRQEESPACNHSYQRDYETFGDSKHTSFSSFAPFENEVSLNQAVIPSPPSHLQNFQDQFDYSSVLKTPFNPLLEANSAYFLSNQISLPDSHSYASSFDASLSPPSSPLTCVSQIHTEQNFNNNDAFSLTNSQQAFSEIGYDASNWIDELDSQQQVLSFPEFDIPEIKTETCSNKDHLENFDYLSSSIPETSGPASSVLPSSSQLESFNEFMFLPSSPPGLDEINGAPSFEELNFQISQPSPAHPVDLSSPETAPNISPVSPFAQLVKLEPTSPQKPSFALDSSFSHLDVCRHTDNQKAFAKLSSPAEYVSEFEKFSSVCDHGLDISNANINNTLTQQFALSAPYESCIVTKKPEPFITVKEEEQLAPKIESADLSITPQVTEHDSKPPVRISYDHRCKTRKQSTRICRIPPETMASLYCGPEADGKYVCLYNGCNKRIARKYNVESHIQTHLSDRPYRCDLCKAGFVRHHDLKRHLRIHENGRPYVCECLKRFNRLDALNRHKQRNICVGGVDRRQH